MSDESKIERVFYNPIGNSSAMVSDRGCLWLHMSKERLLMQFIFAV